MLDNCIHGRTPCEKHNSISVVADSCSHSPGNIVSLRTLREFRSPAITTFSCRARMLYKKSLNFNVSARSCERKPICRLVQGTRGEHGHSWRSRHMPCKNAAISRCTLLPGTRVTLVYCVCCVYAANICFKPSSRVHLCKMGTHKRDKTGESQCITVVCIPFIALIFRRWLC